MTHYRAIGEQCKLGCEPIFSLPSHFATRRNQERRQLMTPCLSLVSKRINFVCFHNLTSGGQTNTGIFAQSKQGVVCVCVLCTLGFVTVCNVVPTRRWYIKEISAFKYLRLWNSTMISVAQELQVPCCLFSRCFPLRPALCVACETSNKN